MAESLDQRVCDDCGVIVTSSRQECSECGKLLRPNGRRRSRRSGIDLDRDMIEEFERSLESRLSEGFTMLNWE